MYRRNGLRPKQSRSMASRDLQRLDLRARARLTTTASELGRRHILVLSGRSNV